GRKRQSMAQAVTACLVPQNPFRGNVDRVRAAALDPLRDLRGCSQRKPYLSVGGHRQAWKLIWREKLNLMSAIYEDLGHLFQSPDDAIDLGFPCVGYDQNLHLPHLRLLRSCPA